MTPHTCLCDIYNKFNNIICRMGSTPIKHPSYHGNHPISQLAQICATVNMGFLKVEISSFDKMYVDKCGTSKRPYSLNKPLLGL